MRHCKHCTDKKNRRDLENVDEPSIYKPCSLNLSTDDNPSVSEENGYILSFTTALVDGDCIRISKDGTNLVFIKDGSYRFELNGDANIYSDVDVKFVLYSDDFSDDMIPFTQVDIGKSGSKLCMNGISTILSLAKRQRLTLHIYPRPDEAIIIKGKIRVMIYRVS